MPAAAPASRAVWMLLGVVLAAHLTVAWVSHDGVIQDDAEECVLLGRNLAAGHGYVFEPGRLPTSWRAPGYPFFLAVLFWLTDGSLAAARVASALLWTVTALLTHLLARRLTGQSSALFAAALAGLSPELVGLTGLLWSETLFTCLFLAAVWAMARWRTDRPSWWAAAAIGGLIGAAALTRSTAVILVPVLWFCAITSQVPATRRARAGLLAKAGLATTLGMVVVGAWSMRNFNEHGHFILVESNVGFNLYLGHSHDTPMPFAWRKASRLDQDRVYWRSSATRLTRAGTGNSRGRPSNRCVRTRFAHSSSRRARPSTSGCPTSSSPATSARAPSGGPTRTRGYLCSP